MPNVYPKEALRGFKAIHKAHCFVLMPFAAKFGGAWTAIRDALQSRELNLIAQRADDFRSPNILETILRGIAQAEFILADLTDANPNVFYELGIAHCVKDSAKVILLTQSMSFVPFDLRHLRCITYSDSKSGFDELRRELIATFAEYSKDTFRFKVHEGKRFEFDKKLVGKGNNLFTIGIECPHVGRDAVKVYVHFKKFSVDEPGTVKSQFLFLSEDQRTVALQNIPWQLHLVESAEQEALLQLEKWR
jgi:hypothetical protein